MRVQIGRLPAMSSPPNGDRPAGKLPTGEVDLPPGIRAIAKWNFPPLNGRRRKTHEAEAFY